MIKCDTIILKAPLSQADVEAVAKAVKACKIVAFPTDTVYGLGSTGLVKAAARKIYEIKGRPSVKPLPVLVDSVESARKWVEWTPAADALARKFWPGALTLVLRPTEEGRLLTFAEFQTVAIRVPDQPELRRLIAASGVPWISTSANLSSSPSLVNGEDVVKQFDGLVDYIVDAGRTAGRESSIADATSLPVRVLREGALTPQQIFAALSE